jgi:hypothetical protein
MFNPVPWTGTMTMARNVVFWGGLLWLAGAAATMAQVTVSTNPIADAFVRSADPTHNYGGAGALSVSGLVATNGSGQQQGQLDSFLRFDASGAVNQFNSTYGAGQWTITGVTLTLTEQAAPAQNIFNRGVGSFEVRWIGNDSWAEGTGTPISVSSTGIKWNDEPSILNPGVDQSLGTFVNGGTNGTVRLSLNLNASFVSDLSTGVLVSLYMTAPTNSTVGFTFNAREFGTASARPSLSVTAVAVPEPGTAALVLVAGPLLLVQRWFRRG